MKIHKRGTCIKNAIKMLLIHFNSTLTFNINTEGSLVGGEVMVVCSSCCWWLQLIVDYMLECDDLDAVAGIYRTG